MCWKESHIASECIAIGMCSYVERSRIFWKPCCNFSSKSHLFLHVLRCIQPEPVCVLTVHWACVSEGPQDVFASHKGSRCFSGIVSLTHSLPLPVLAGVVCQTLFFFLMVPVSLIVSYGKKNDFTTSPLWHFHMSEKIPQILGFFPPCCWCVTSTFPPMGDKLQLFTNFKGRIHDKTGMVHTFSIVKLQQATIKWKTNLANSHKTGENWM